MTGIEMRGPVLRGFSAGGAKAVFRFPCAAGLTATLLAVAEAAIDALSLAALEDLRSDTLYAAVAGRIGTLTVTCLEQELRTLAARAAAVLAAATDADAAGERIAACLTRLAAAAGAAGRLRSARPGGGDPAPRAGAGLRAVTDHPAPGGAA